MKANVLGHLSGFEKSERIEKFEKAQMRMNYA